MVLDCRSTLRAGQSTDRTNPCSAPNIYMYMTLCMYTLHVHVYTYMYMYVLYMHQHVNCALQITERGGECTCTCTHTSIQNTYNVHTCIQKEQLLNLHHTAIVPTLVSMTFHSHVCVHACAAALTESERSEDTLGQSAPHLDLCGLVGHRDKEPPELGPERREGEREGGREGGRERGREGGRIQTLPCCACSTKDIAASLQAPT